ncbi:ABC transporter ATP-binding protein [Paenibacillus allorhizosphaerae]|uniref:ABC transporter ATP-binding protein n=1 Tax=Paenibacillus allorhizosphaerae TaxID=2849866 RepID=A0ABN7TR12_9BACL|nr:ABC transporter ATP-binding protein [Paenibacillus allorhizosphaerae]CAG7647681.1 putative ABC transporter ATP-binding protein [Paenibacillus allorhizosphaerae]
MNVDFKQYRDLLVTYLQPQGAKVIALGAMLLFGTAISLVNPQLIKSFIDAATSGRSSFHALLGLGLLFVTATFVSQLVSVCTVYLGQVVGWSATNALRVDLLRHCLRLDMSFFNKRTPGELIERIDGDCNNLFSFLSGFVFQLLSSAMLLIGIIGLLFVENWRMGIALSLFSAISIVILIRTRGIAIPSGRREQEARTHLYGFLEERLTGMADLRTNGGFPHMMRTFYELHSSRFLTARKAWMVGRMSTWGITAILIAIGNIITFSISIFLYQRGQITIGAIYLMFHYTEMLFRPLDQITSQLQKLQSTSVSIIRLNELYRMQSAVEDQGCATMASGPADIRFRDVSFSYGDQGSVLDQVSFHLEPNQVLGLLGRTGSGKTTMTRLLFRMYDPCSGEIRFNGTNLKDIPLGLLQQKIGMVTQEVQLFQGTIRDNLSFFDASVSDERMLEAIQTLGLDEWFHRLPDGLDTYIRSGGEGLSAGEAQLVAFTRVLLKDPDLVILDEFSSRLDSLTEQWIQGALKRLLLNRTGIIIAHRLATVRHVNHIMILDGGRIVEYGCREELEQDSGSRYSRLLQTGLEVQTA